MRRQHGSLYFIGLCAALCLSLAPGTAAAQDIAWDMVSSTSQNLLSFTTDAPVFTSPACGFEKFTYDPLYPDVIPYALIDDTAGVYPADQIGIIDSSTDFNEFFGVVDLVNNDLPGPPYHATWVFDISSATGTPELWIDLAAMGDFEATAAENNDSYEWSWQVDGGPVTTMLTALADEAVNQTYTMADGTVRVVDDPLMVGATMLSNQFTSFMIPITAGSQLTLILTSTTDGISEAYAVRNIKVTGELAIFVDGFETGDTSLWSAALP